MMQKVPFKAVLFDLDGTLINSAPDAIAAINHVFSSRYDKSFSVEQISTYLVGGIDIDRILASLAVLGDLLLTSEDLSQLKVEYVAYYRQHPTRYTKIFPGVMQCLKDLRDQGVILAICSNKPSITARLVVKKLGLDEYFSCIIAGDDTPRKKPDPLHVRLALENIMVSPEDAVMVGDAQPDIKSAQAMGMPAVLFADSGILPEGLKPDAYFHSFSCLIRTLCSLRS